MTLLEHLEEFRVRLIRCVVALAIGTLVGYFLADRANEIMVRPFDEAGLGKMAADRSPTMRLELEEDGTLRIADRSVLDGQQDEGPKELRQFEIVDAATGAVLARVGDTARSSLVFLKPMDPLMIRLKTAGVLGIIFALPVILWQTMAFIAPGLLETERRALLPMVAMALFLFPAGTAFAYLTMKYAIVFCAEYGFGQVEFMNDARAYLGFALTTLLICGAVAELPVLVMMLVRLGIVSHETLAGKRKIIFVAILIVSSVLTPPDPFTLIAMAIPLYGLFELSLLLSRTSGPKRVADETIEPSKA